MASQTEGLYLRSNFDFELSTAYHTAAAQHTASNVDGYAQPHLKQYLSTWISAPLSALTLLQSVLQNC